MVKINRQLSRNFIFVSMLSIAFITIVANISITFLFSTQVIKNISTVYSAIFYPMHINIPLRMERSVLY